MIEIHEYDNIRLVVIILLTLVSFLWVFRVSEYRVKVWYALVAFFIFIYSGVGGAIEEVKSEYVFYYAIYIVTLSLTLYFFNKKRNKEKNRIEQEKTDYIVERFIDNNGAFFIILYFFLLLLDLVYPTFRLDLLISPPSPSLEDLHYNNFVVGNTKDGVSQLIYLLQQFVSPFFYLSLYKYRKNYKIILILLLFPVYIDLCNRGIIGRGESMIPFIIVFISSLEKLKPKNRKRLIIVSAGAIPFVCYAAVQFSFIRVGAGTVNISLTDSVQMIFGQEVAYPLHFNEYIGRGQAVSILDYILWIVLLPVPGFLKFGYGDPQINLMFTQMITGMDPTQMGFSICLPGLVGESIIVFGPLLFPVHAIIVGIIISVLIKYLSKCKSYEYLFYFATIIFSYSICRGGTSSAYSFAFKQFLVLVVFIYLLKKNRKYKMAPNIFANN